MNDFIDIHLLIVISFYDNKILIKFEEDLKNLKLDNKNFLF